MRIYDLILSLFVAILIISNIVTIKVFEIKIFSLRLIFDGGAIVFPISYIFADIFTEVYGYKKTRKIIWLGFFVLILFNVLLYLVVLLPPEESWNRSVGQENFEKVLGISPRIAVAGIIGYFWGEFTNSFILAKMKIINKGSKMWNRIILSTVVGQLVDTTIFCTLAFAGIMDLKSLINYIVTGYFYKVLVEFAFSPLTLLLIKKIKNMEGIDIYDYNTNFNPFIVKFVD